MVLLRALLIVALLTAMVAVAVAGKTCTETFLIAGRKYKVQNRPLQAGEGVVCPEGNPFSTVTFCKVGKKVKILGNFAASNLGVCDPNVNPYTLLTGAAVTYEQYGDQVILRIPDSVPSAFRCMVLDYGKVCVGLSGQRYGVSTLTDLGPANC